MNFEWDNNKKQENLRKHSISFELASEVFFDSGAIMGIDDRIDYDEVREFIIGQVSDVILYVVYTIRGKNIRIISARKANKQERGAYNDYY